MSAADGPCSSGVRLPRAARVRDWAIGPEARRRLAWLAAGIIMAAVTWSAMVAEVAAARHPVAVLAGEDFWNNTWWAVRTLLAGADIYGPTHAVVPGIELAWPVAPHVPASLLWQAPFAALPVPAALYAFTVASVAAIWVGIIVLTRPTEPLAILGCAACGAFALLIGGGPETLLLGQPTGFILLGLAIVVRAKQPWLAGLGFLFAASTLQAGLPLALALLVLRGWPVLWRGLTLTVACSVPAVGIGIASNGFDRFLSSFVHGAVIHLGRQSNRIDLGAMLRAFGVSSVELRVACWARRRRTVPCVPGQAAAAGPAHRQSAGVLPGDLLDAAVRLPPVLRRAPRRRRRHPGDPHRRPIMVHAANVRFRGRRGRSRRLQFSRCRRTALPDRRCCG